MLMDRAPQTNRNQRKTADLIAHRSTDEVPTGGRLVGGGRQSSSDGMTMTGDLVPDVEYKIRSSICMVNPRLNKKRHHDYTLSAAHHLITNSRWFSNPIFSRNHRWPGLGIERLNGAGSSGRRDHRRGWKLRAMLELRVTHGDPQSERSETQRRDRPGPCQRTRRGEVRPKMAVPPAGDQRAGGSREAAPDHMVSAVHSTSMHHWSRGGDADLRRLPHADDEVAMTIEIAAPTHNNERRRRKRTKKTTLLDRDRHGRGHVRSG